MISKLTLENFKAFKNMENLEIAPLTILCGGNSSGKSTILQSILLIKQTLESQNPYQSLLLNGRHTHLGLVENVVHNKKVSNEIVFKFNISVTSRELFQLRRKIYVPFTFIKELFLKDLDFSSDAVVNLHFKICVKTNPESRHLKSIKISEFEFSAEIEKQGNLFAEEGVLKGAYIQAKCEQGDLYKITWKNLKNRVRLDEKEVEGNTEGEAKFSVEFANLFPISFKLEEKDEQSNLRAIHYTFHRIQQILQINFNSYTYIGPLREEPARRYIYEDEVVEIGNKGENAAFIFSTEHDHNIREHFFYNQQTDSFSMQQTTTLSDAIQKWAATMGIHDLRPEYNKEIIHLNLNSSSFNKTRVNIADVGFGVSQIFPILVEGLRMQKGSTLLLEQPEIHLHPGLQMQMADYFISLALSGKRIIAETHSDHLVNRLVRRSLEKGGEEIRKLIKIYFIKTSEEGSVVEEIKIDKEKGVSNWPEGFFDQTATEQEKIIRAILRNGK